LCQQRFADKNVSRLLVANQTSNWQLRSDRYFIAGFTDSSSWQPSQWNWLCPFVSLTDGSNHQPQCSQGSLAPGTFPVPNNIYKATTTKLSQIKPSETNSKFENDSMQEYLSNSYLALAIAFKKL